MLFVIFNKTNPQRQHRVLKPRWTKFPFSIGTNFHEPKEEFKSGNFENHSPKGFPASFPGSSKIIPLQSRNIAKLPTENPQNGYSIDQSHSGGSPSSGVSMNSQIVLAKSLGRSDEKGFSTIGWIPPLDRFPLKRQREREKVFKYSSVILLLFYVLWSRNDI